MAKALRTEVIAGVTTFLTMSYIIFVQPAVLSTDFAGKPTGLDLAPCCWPPASCSGAGHIAMGGMGRLPDRARARDGRELLLSSPSS
jgi:AGZA family xanthine/uracil permease-like MFS transporter